MSGPPRSLHARLPFSWGVLRGLSAWLEATPEAISVGLPGLAQELGLGANVGRSSPVIRTLARLLRFQAAAPAGDVLAVRRFLAPLPYRLAAQLPPRLAAAHDLDQHRDRPAC